MILRITLSLTLLLIGCTLTTCFTTCSEESCCIAQQNPNPSTGSGYLQFDAGCVTGQSLNCVENSGCQLCFNPQSGARNLGNRPNCTRFSLQFPCANDACCFAIQNPNFASGEGFYQFNQRCLPNGGLHCVENTGCELCFNPNGFGPNHGDRPICTRFNTTQNPSNATNSAQCFDDQCCQKLQNPNLVTGEGFLEFSADCLQGGLNCVENSGCLLCFNPNGTGPNHGDRPICNRTQAATSTTGAPKPTTGGTTTGQATSTTGQATTGQATTGQATTTGQGTTGGQGTSGTTTTTTGGTTGITLPCTSEQCCEAIQFPNTQTGEGFYQFVPSCVHGGPNCVDETGCQICFNPNGAGPNHGDRPICTRFNRTTTSTSTSTSSSSSSSTGAATTTSTSGTSSTTSAGTCTTEQCCEDLQRPNTVTGEGYLEFSFNCLNGGLNCFENTGCRICFNPNGTGPNHGDRPICDRFKPKTSGTTAAQTTGTTAKTTGTTGTTGSTSTTGGAKPTTGVQTTGVQTTGTTAAQTSGTTAKTTGTTGSQTSGTTASQTSGTTAKTTGTTGAQTTGTTGVQTTGTTAKTTGTTAAQTTGTTASQTTGTTAKTTGTTGAQTTGTTAVTTGTTGVQTTGTTAKTTATTGVQTTGVQTTGTTAKTTGSTTGAQTTGTTAKTTGSQTTVTIPTTGVIIPLTTGGAKPTTGVQTTGVQTTGVQTTGIQTTGVHTTGVHTTGVHTTVHTTHLTGEPPKQS